MVTVALVGNDGHSVSVPVQLARYSKTITAAIAPFIDEGSDEVVTFSFPPSIPASQAVLDEVVRYMSFKHQWDGKWDVPRFDLKIDILHDLTIVADYLDI